MILQTKFHTANERECFSTTPFAERLNSMHKHSKLLRIPYVRSPSCFTVVHWFNELTQFSQLRSSSTHRGFLNSRNQFVRANSNREISPQTVTNAQDFGTSSIKPSVNLKVETPLSAEEMRIPKSIHDISNGDHILGFGANLDEDHPGFHDVEYKNRRTYIANLAKLHKIGDPIPEIDYTEEETRIWGEVLSRLSRLYPTHACKVYLDSFPNFQFSVDTVPQLQNLSEILHQHTGWRIRPVAGLLHPRDFINGLAFRYFHSTQYIRHGSNPMYTPEPDLCHEVLGHIPMLADPSFCDLAQAIGLASLGASDKEMWHLTKLYWYTVEFGTVMEEGEIKAFGAGLLSSFGELIYMKEGKNGALPNFVELDPFSKLPKISYKEGFQKTYFMSSSFTEMADKIKAYSKSIHHGKSGERTRL